MNPGSKFGQRGGKDKFAKEMDILPYGSFIERREVRNTSSEGGRFHCLTERKRDQETAKWTRQPQIILLKGERLDGENEGR